MLNRFKYLLKKYSLFRVFVFLSIFIFFSASAMYISSLRNSAPIIISVLPEIFDEDGVITLRGKNFGKGEGASFLKIGDVPIAAEACSKWTDNEICFTVLGRTEGGIIYVAVNNKISNPGFIFSSSAVPVVKEHSKSKSAPSILSLDRDLAEVGALIKIYGENFGAVRKNSQIFFAKHFDPAIMSDNKANLVIDAVCCSEHDFDFEFWSNTEVRIRVPEGADSGVIFVMTEEGISNPVPFRLKNRVGTKTFTDVKKFLVSAEANISNIEGESKNTMFLRVPLPEKENAQTDLKLISIIPAPLAKNYKGASVHQFDNLTYESKIKIRQEYSLNRFAVFSAINPEKIRLNSINNRKLYNAYTVATPLIPSNDEEIKNKAAQIVKNEKNPYIKAKKIYDFMLQDIRISENETNNIGKPLASVFKEKEATPYDASLLFCALARAAGVPSEPIAGIAVDKDQVSKPHWWAEFYVEGFGWVPVDIGMAKSVPFSTVNENPEIWYFGNIDSLRISFSKGEKRLPPMTVSGQVSAKERSFAFRNAWEEAVNITAYTSLWQTPNIEAVY